MPVKYNKPINPMLLTDFYKVCHKAFYRKGITQLVSYWTPRKSRLERINYVVQFGLQAYIKKYLIDYFNVHFFETPWGEQEKIFTAVIGESLDPEIAAYEAAGFKQLWDLGYLPIEISALPEGTLVPIGCPSIQFRCTKPEFFWLAEYLETLTSCNIWFPTTDATIAYKSRKLLDKYYDLSVDDDVPRAFGAGNFSMRGMTSVESAPMADAGHLLSFASTATVPSLWWLHCFYNAPFDVAKGTASTEHSVMESYTPEGEFGAYEHLITNVRPNGNLSMVSDTWNLWRVVTEYLPKLKDKIEAREGKIIIRPDSGDPVEIVCGKNYEFFDTDRENATEFFTKMAEKDQTGEYSSLKYIGRTVDDYIEVEVYFADDDDGEYMFSADEVDIITMRPLLPEEKGVVELIWDFAGGTINSKGYKVLNGNYGVIYGDAITHEIEIAIFEGLMRKGFACNNIVLGFGSYTYQYVTRDTFGFALKVTAGTIDGEELALFKDPITDHTSHSAMKKSQKGMCVVFRDENGAITFTQGHKEADVAQRSDNLLRPVFRDSQLLVDEDFDTIRNRLHSNFWGGAK